MTTESILSFPILAPTFPEYNDFGIFGDFFDLNLDEGAGNVGHPNQRHMRRARQQDGIQIMRRSDHKGWVWKTVDDQQIVGGDLVLRSGQFEDRKQAPRRGTGPQDCSLGFGPPQRTVRVVQGLPIE